MRILHVTDFFLPRVGGIEMFVAELAAHQAAAGHDVTVLTPTRDRSGTDEQGPVRVLRTKQPPTPLSFPVRPRRSLVDVAAYDVVHAHVSVAAPFSTKMAQAGVRAGVPTITTVHSMWNGWEPMVNLIGLIAGWRRWPVVWTAVSEAAAADMRVCLGDDAPVHVVPNAVEIPWWRELPPRPDEGRPVTLVSVMRLAGRKRPLQLLEVLARTRDEVPDAVPLRAVIVGEGPLEDRLQARITALGLEDWVEMAGGRTREEIRELFRNASAYVAPSHKESFGLAALEARAAGLPVVAMRSGGVGEFVRDGLEGLICEDDDAMVDALVRLATDRELRRGMAGHNVANPPAIDWSVPMAGFDAAYATARRVSADWSSGTRLDVGRR